MVNLKIIFFFNIAEIKKALFIDTRSELQFQIRLQCAQRSNLTKCCRYQLSTRYFPSFRVLRQQNCHSHKTNV